MHKDGTYVHKFRGPQAAAFCALGSGTATIRNCKVIGALSCAILRQRQNHSRAQREKQERCEDNDRKGLGGTVSIGQHQIFKYIGRHFDDLIREVCHALLDILKRKKEPK